MATWRPPKISYWVTPPAKVPGGEDFQRIEENTQYLKELRGEDFQRIEENTQYLKELIEDFQRIEENTQYLKELIGVPTNNRWMTISNNTILESLSTIDYQSSKSFLLIHPGSYRVTFEGRGSAYSGLYSYVYILAPGFERSVNVYASFASYTVDIPVLPPFGYVNIRTVAQSSPTGTYADLRNVRIRGTLSSSVPTGPKVL